MMISINYFYLRKINPWLVSTTHQKLKKLLGKTTIWNEIIQNSSCALFNIDAVNEMEMWKRTKINCRSQTIVSAVLLSSACCLTLSIYCTYSLISAPIGSLTFPLMGFVLLIICLLHSTINQKPCKGEQIRPGSELRCDNEHNFAGPAAGNPNALSVTCCEVMTVHVTL